MEIPASARVVDLGELRSPRGPGSLHIELIVRYAADVYADLREAFPTFGVTSPADEPVPGMGLTGEDGVVRVYMLQPAMLEFLQSNLGANGAALDMIERLAGVRETDQGEGDPREDALAFLAAAGRLEPVGEKGDAAEEKGEPLPGDE